MLKQKSDVSVFQLSGLGGETARELRGGGLDISKLSQAGGPERTNDEFGAGGVIPSWGKKGRANRRGGGSSSGVAVARQHPQGG
jgi:hypothetical protein